MYQVYIDEKLLYAPTVENGLKVGSAFGRGGYNLFDPKLSTEVNKAGSLTFTVPANHPNFDLTSHTNYAVSVLDTDMRSEAPIWVGHIVQYTDNMDGSRSCVCEGELAYLNCAIMEPYSTDSLSLEEYLKLLINSYNSAIELLGSSKLHLTVSNFTELADWGKYDRSNV